MLERKLCKVSWLILSLVIVVSLLVWKLSGCPGPPPKCAITYANFLRLVPENVTTAPPPYRFNALPADDPSTLINLTDFTFLAKGRCNSSDFLILVVSSPSHEFNRNAIRETWGRTHNLVFLLGKANSSVEPVLDNEIRAHGDIVQGNFIDSYRNLTYKHVMGLKWVTYHCPWVKYILKIDDDVFVNTLLLKEFLEKELSPLGARRLIMCNVLPVSLAKRTYRSKWRVSPAEYPARWYPSYCAGWVVLYSPDVAFTLYSHAQEAPYFWIDDVHLTGTLASQANFSHTSIRSFSFLESAGDLFTSSPRPIKDFNFLFILSSPQRFYSMWEMVKSHDYS